MQELAQIDYLELIMSLAGTDETGTQRTVCVPSGLVVCGRLTMSEDWGRRFFTPMKQMLPFRGERDWVTLMVDSWSDLAQAPERLVRYLVSAAGLYGKFRGGVVIDLRRCEGCPPTDVFAELEGLLRQLEGELYPLFLVEPEQRERVLEQLWRLDIRSVALTVGVSSVVEEELEQMEELTREAKALLLEQIRQGMVDESTAMRAARRSVSRGWSTQEEIAGLLNELCPRQRQIGFGSSPSRKREEAREYD